MENLTPQKLDKQGLKTLVDWARAEGWNPGPYDHEAFWSADPDGFYGFYQDDTLIAGGAVVSYEGRYGFMGLFIVRPEYRGKGIGRTLWYFRRDLLLSRLDNGATIGMDGVVDMQPFYAKGGFNIAFKDERYECTGRRLETDEGISMIEDDDIENILSYDAQCFGFSREAFMRYWLSMPGGSAFKFTDGVNITGFAVIRKADIGFKIGPLFADDKQVAEELYKACLNSAVDEPVYLDIPMINSDAVELVKKYDARYVFECARMYHGDEPSVDINKTFGITTFELG